jgi:hypothetical protein
MDKRKITISISISLDLLTKIDKARGILPRSLFLQNLLERRLKWKI